jgi:hypothetical protein
MADETTLGWQHETLRHNMGVGRGAAGYTTTESEQWLPSSIGW